MSPTTQTPIVRKFDDNLEEMRRRLGVGLSFDVIERQIQVAGKRASLFFIDGFLKDKVTADVINALQEVSARTPFRGPSRNSWNGPSHTLRSTQSTPSMRR